MFRDLGALATTLARGLRADPQKPTGAVLAALAREVRAEPAVALCTTRDGRARP